MPLPRSPPMKRRRGAGAAPAEGTKTNNTELSEITLRLQNEVGTQLKLKTLRDNAKKNNNVLNLSSITIVAERGFQIYGPKFIQASGMEDLLGDIAEFARDTLTDFVIKLLPNSARYGVTVSAGDLACLLEMPKLSSVKLINVPLSGRIDWLEEALVGEKNPVQTLEVVKCDFSSLKSTERCASLRFLEALSRAPKLTKLNLNGVQFHPGISLTEAIPRLVQTPPSHIEDLSLKNCPAVTTEAVLGLIDGLTTNGKLRILHLDPDESSGLSNECFRAMGEMLHTNNTLQEIQVRMSPHETIDLLPIAQALKTNRKLEKFLYLSHRPYRPTPEVIQNLEEALHESGYLKRIGMGGGNSSNSDGWGPTITKYLAMNQAGRQILFDEVDNKCTTEDWMRVMLACHKDVRTVFYFLSRNPAKVQHFIKATPEANEGDLNDEEKEREEEEEHVRKKQRVD